MISEKYPEILLATSKTFDGNMSFVRGDAPEALENRKRFLISLGLDINSIVVMSPQHGTDILKVGKSDLGKGAKSLDDVFKVDGLITNESGVNLFVIIADCHAIALYDPTHHAIGLVHAGWKGLDLNILANTVAAMKNSFQTEAQDLLAQFSPSLGPCCYKPAYPDNTPSKLKNYIGKYFGDEYSIDIWKYAEDQLKEAGLLPENIYNPKLCTYHSGEYFSHRRAEIEKLKDDFRIATVLGIK